jgi:hypothetical protein
MYENPEWIYRAEITAWYNDDYEERSAVGDETVSNPP